MMRKMVAPALTILLAVAGCENGTSEQNVAKVVIDENTITNGAKPILIYHEQPKVSGAK